MYIIPLMIQNSHQPSASSVMQYQMSDSLRLSLRLRLSIGPIEPISGLSWPNFLHIKAHSQVHSRYFLDSQFYHFDCTQFDSYRHLDLYQLFESICLTVLGAVIQNSSILSKCEICALSKAIEIVSRRSDKEDPANEPLARVAYDLIQLSTVYNNKKWISHFHCYFTGMDFIYTHAKKS